MKPSFENRDPLLFFLLALGPFRPKPIAKNGGWKNGKTEEFGLIGNHTPELPDSRLGRDVNYPRFYALSHTHSERDIFSFIMSVLPYVCPSVCKHLSARLRLEGFL